MFKGNLFFIASAVPQLVFFKTIFGASPDAILVSGFIAITAVCSLLSISIMVRYFINVRRYRTNLFEQNA